MYGKCDLIFVRIALDAASYTGSLVRVGSGKSLSQYAYVGNVAVAHLCVLKSLMGPNGSQCAGQAYFVNDDTPLMNTFTFMEVFLKPCGYSVSSFQVPF